jgi:nicotinate-nucleotide adenylyltransferase
MKKIGLLGGSFDPIHFGHLHLAIRMLEHHGLDEILFCPAFCTPFKVNNPPVASVEDRLEMLQLALEEVPQCKITTVEIERKGTSFTVDTLRVLKRPDVQYHLILTNESFESFSSWKEPCEIKKLAILLIGPRSFPISSTEIRARFKKRLYCGHLIPAKALDYINKNQLYFSA